MFKPICEPGCIEGYGGIKPSDGQQRGEVYPGGGASS